MKKVDSNNGVWVNDDPTTLTNGTPIDADVMNNIQDEISNVITDNGGTLDGTNHSQLSQTLNKNFAKLNSPTLTGIPLTSNPDGTIDNQIATVDYVNQKALQATVGFTPVQQSGGDNQGANKVYIGADKTDSNQVRVQVDQTDLGKIVFQEENNDTYGIKQIGYNHTSDFISTLDSNNNYHNIHTADYIDAKQWISSLPDGNNLKVSDIIWNSSSSLPALYYGTDNSVAYLATETWANTTFVKNNAGTGGGVVALDLDGDGSGRLTYLDQNNAWHAVQPAGDYATKSWSNNSFVSKAIGVYDYAPLQAGISKSSGQIWLTYTNDSGGTSYAFAQPAGDYATNTALNTETSNRESVDSSLQDQINGRVLKTGDTMYGGLTIEGGTGGFVAQYNPGSPSSGTYINYPGFVSIAEGRGGEFHLQLQEEVGTKFKGLFSLRDGNGNWRYMSIPMGSRINDSAYGDVAYVNDLSSYVSTSTYSNDFNTADSRVINLPYGHRIQFFTVYIDGNGTNGHRINYPQAFSGNSTVTFNLNDTGQSRSVSLSNNTTPDSTGFNISVSGHGNSSYGNTDGLTLTVIAIGPK